jgi:hypothetical protein
VTTNDFQIDQISDPGLYNNNKRSLSICTGATHRID